MPARVGSFEAAAAGGSFGGVAQKPAVHSGGFADAAAPAATPIRPVPRPQSSDGAGVEILFKPQPAYSEEARRLRIEGSVLLEVLFGRSGRVEVLRVIKGLGHGLDDKAAEAARQIRFKPARADGQPVDLTATIRISFELAY